MDSWSTHLQPADGAVLPRHHRQRGALPRLRLAAGQHGDVRCPASRPSARSRRRTGSSRAAARAATSPCDPKNPDIVFGGAIGSGAGNGRLIRYDRRTGQERNVTVWPDVNGMGDGAKELKYRFQWTFPLLFSPHDPNALYVDLERRPSLDRRGRRAGRSISPDLTRNDATKTGSLRRPDHQGQHRRGGLLHDLRLRRVAARSGRLLGRARTTAWSTSPAMAARPGRTSRRRRSPEWALISVIEPSPHDAGHRLRRRDALQAGRLRAVPLQDERLRQDLDSGSRTGIRRRRLHARHPRGPGAARPAVRGDGDGRLRLVR